MNVHLSDAPNTKEVIWLSPFTHSIKYDADGATYDNPCHTSNVKFSNFAMLTSLVILLSICVLYALNVEVIGVVIAVKLADEKE